MSQLLPQTTIGLLHDALAQSVCEPPEQIRVLVLATDEDLGALVKRRAPFRIDIGERNGFQVAHFGVESGDAEFSGDIALCPTSIANIFYLVAVCSATEWDRVIMRLVKALGSRVFVPFFSQSELYKLLTDSEALFPGAQLRVKAHSRKQRLTSGRRAFEVSRTRTDKTLETVFREAEDQNSWFQSVSFDYFVEGRAPAEVSAMISKYGVLACSAGFERFRLTVLNDMAGIARQKFQFFDNRSRMKTTDFEAKPITIRYGRSMFKLGEENTKFIAIMRKMPGASCSVVHGNPYMHLSILDGDDSSGSDLWVFQEDELLVVPQIRASASALKHLVNYIFEEWGEGELINLAA